MPRVGRQFHRRHHLVADDVDGVEVVRQPDEVLIVGQIALAAAIDPVMHIGRAGDQAEHQRIAAEMHLLLRIAAGQREGGRNRPQRFGNQALVDPDGLFLAVDDGAGRREQIHHLVRSSRGCRVPTGCASRCRADAASDPRPAAASADRDSRHAARAAARCRRRCARSSICGPRRACPASSSLPFGSLFSQFRTENRFTLFLELLSSRAPD